jgi:hypothetical protein
VNLGHGASACRLRTATPVTNIFPQGDEIETAGDNDVGLLGIDFDILPSLPGHLFSAQEAESPLRAAPSPAKRYKR